MKTKDKIDISLMIVELIVLIKSLFNKEEEKK
jgi:hypothetical protein